MDRDAALVYDSVYKAMIDVFSDSGPDPKCSRSEHSVVRVS